jgi:hypothetical protein
MTSLQRIEPTTRREPWLQRLPAFLGVAALFLIFTAIYETCRYLVGPDSGTAALRHARDLIDVERAMGLFIEPRVQRFAEAVPLLERVAVTIYKYEHLVGSIAFLLWLWARRPTAFPFVWRWFWIAHCVALLVFMLYPVAPPRLVPELGLADPTAADLASTPGWAVFERYRNDFAAMPSLHVGYPTLFAVTLWFVLPGKVARWFVWCWPAAVLFSVVATANHYWIDGLAGMVTVALALVMAIVLFPGLPRPWAVRNSGR